MKRIQYHRETNLCHRQKDVRTEGRTDDGKMDGQTNRVKQYTSTTLLKGIYRKPLI